MYGVGSRPYVQLIQWTCSSMCRHMYNWNIVDWDVISKKWTWTQNWHLLQKLDLNNIEFVENAQNEESAIYFKGNKFGEDVPIKKKQAWQVCTGVEEGGSGRGGGHVRPLQKWVRGHKWVCAPPSPFGQNICSNFAVCSQFVFRN